MILDLLAVVVIICIGWCGRTGHDRKSLTVSVGRVLIWGQDGFFFRPCHCIP